MPAGAAPEPPVDDLPAGLAWTGLAVLCLAGGLSGLLECLLVPLYAGSVPLPVAVPAALLGNAVLPRLGRRLVPSTLGAALPLLVWLAVVVVFGVLTRPEGDVILPGGSLQWVTYAMVLGGVLVGTATVAMNAPLPGSRPPG